MSPQSSKMLSIINLGFDSGTRCFEFPLLDAMKACFPTLRLVERTNENPERFRSSLDGL